MAITKNTTMMLSKRRQDLKMFLPFSQIHTYCYNLPKYDTRITTTSKAMSYSDDNTIRAAGILDKGGHRSVMY